MLSQRSLIHELTPDPETLPAKHVSTGQAEYFGFIVSCSLSYTYIWGSHISAYTVHSGTVAQKKKKNNNWEEITRKELWSFISQHATCKSHFCTSLFPWPVDLWSYLSAQRGFLSVLDGGKLFRSVRLKMDERYRERKRDSQTYKRWISQMLVTQTRKWDNRRGGCKTTILKIWQLHLFFLLSHNVIKNVRLLYIQINKTV